MHPIPALELAPHPMSAKSTASPVGRVVAVHRSHWLIQDSDGTLHKATAKFKAGAPVVGDRVRFSDASGGRVHIDTIEARDATLQRIDRRGQPKPLAANHTRLVVVCAPAPGIDRLLIDQYLVAADHGNVLPILVINKADLIDDINSLAPMIEAYSQARCPSVLTCAKTGEGLDTLSELLRGQVAIFVGPSGVGKSSIIQHFVPDRDIRVGELSAAGMGSHTTTASVWYELGEQSAVIDSPGVREFRLDHIPVETVRSGFFEISTLAQNCKFANCSHRHEPDCGVRHAVEDASLDQTRYQNYLHLLAEAEESAKPRA